jgi:hypothetical protein
MALKVVPRGDERCDIHNGRKPATYICEGCVEELGVEPGRPGTARQARIRRARRAFRGGPTPVRRRILRWARSLSRRAVIAAAIGLLIGTFLLIVILGSGGGSGETASGPPTATEVADMLGLSPDPSGTGWITVDGACNVLSIDIVSGNKTGTEAVNSTLEATNESTTIRAAVLQYDDSVSQAACVNRISTGLHDHY